jgi:peroxiredoxin
MNSYRLFGLAVLGLVLFEGSRASSTAAEPPTTEKALALTPIQPLVEYTVPTKAEAAQCTLRSEKDNNSSAWLLRNAQGETLRRFADTNNDNVVDMWCYYLDGLEVYRDIDSNFNGKADQYRWFHTAGTRWGTDKNEDGRIDAWREISPHEVAEQVVLALQSRDPAARAQRFNLLVATPADLNELGAGEARTEQLAALVKTAGQGFAKLAAEQKMVSADSRYVDFGSARPATVPAGTAGATKDVTICDNASALVQTSDKHEQVLLGTLVRVGDAWKLVGTPTIGSNTQPESGNIFLVSSAGAAAGTIAGGPTEEMQKLMAELERLDRDADGLSGDRQADNIEQRANLLLKLADVTPDAQQRNFWYQQLADMLSVAIQTNTFPEAAQRLEDLEQRLIDAGVGEQLVAHVVFQRMWSQYVASQEEEDADTAKIQEKWLADLEAFVEKYPKSTDSAEALLQLGMYQEFVGKADDAKKWYQQLATSFPSAAPAVKARGALRRLSSVGAAIRLQGKDLVSDTAVDSQSYRGKILLIHYWATWSDKCKEDLVLLKDFYAKKGGRDFEILGVCLDSSDSAAKLFLSQNRFPWKQLYEKGGADGRLANELGVMTLPLMILVDRTGRVANNNIQVAELEDELARLQQPATDTAETLRRDRTAR